MKPVSRSKADRLKWEAIDKIKKTTISLESTVGKRLSESELAKRSGTGASLLVP
jgi:DNA-binding GntR family transcriptional regulator